MADDTGTGRPTGTIVVDGTGRVAVKPDLGVIRLGIAISRAEVAEARAEAAATMTAILLGVGAIGIGPDDVRTSALGLQPRYEYRDASTPRLVGYDLSNMVEITVRDLTRLGDVVDVALRSGATSLDGLEMRVSDPSSAERDARTAAVRDARAKAEVLAAAAGLAVEGIIAIEEGAVGPGHPFAKAERMALDADSGTPVSAGTTDVAVTVRVTFRTR